MRACAFVALIGLPLGTVCLAQDDQYDRVIQQLLLETEEEFQEGAEQFIEKLGPKAVAPLIDALGSEKGSARAAAARILGRIGAPAVEALSRAVHDDNWRVRAGAVLALGYYGGPEGTDPLIGALQDAHPVVRTSAAGALGRLQSPQAVHALIAAVNDQKSVVRAAAARALGEIGDARAIPSLIGLLNDRGRVPDDAKRALERIGAPAVAPLGTALKDSNADPRAREAAARALGGIGSADGVDALSIALRDRNQDIRAAAADALVLIGLPALDALRVALLEDPNPEVRAEAAIILGRTGSARRWHRQAMDLLIGGLADADSQVRAAVRKALFRIHVLGVPSLVDALKTTEAPVRIEISTVLAEIGSRSAVGPLNTHLATESDPRVKEALQSTLQVLEEK